MEHFLDSDPTIAHALVKGEVNGTEATKTKNLNNYVAIVKDGVFGEERNGW
jgi:hypothetical protein